MGAFALEAVSQAAFAASLAPHPAQCSHRATTSSSRRVQRYETCARLASLPENHQQLHKSLPFLNQACQRGRHGGLAQLGKAAQRRSTGIMASAAGSAATVPIMVNDCSGKMGHAVAEAAVEAGLQLVPLALTGPGLGKRTVVCGGVAVEVKGAEDREAVMDEVLEKYPGVVVVDYTLPAAVNGNADFYNRRGVPFVMGTTGGDREKLIEDVKKAGTYAVIAPQMGKQVVAFQAAMSIMADNFPGAFANYKLRVTESHQSSKVDTSGTAKAMVEYFKQLGVKFDEDEIEKVREPKEQMERMKVPEAHLLGHAFHTYELISPDGTVGFQFQHNVCGRSIYAQGTVDAVLFLAKKVAKKADKKLYNMIDVLRGGSMR